MLKINNRLWVCLFVYAVTHDLIKLESWNFTGLLVYTFTGKSFLLYFSKSLVLQPSTPFLFSPPFRNTHMLEMHFVILQNLEFLSFSCSFSIHLLLKNIRYLKLYCDKLFVSSVALLVWPVEGTDNTRQPVYQT